MRSAAAASAAEAADLGESGRVGDDVIGGQRHDHGIAAALEREDRAGGDRRRRNRGASAPA